MNEMFKRHEGFGHGCLIFQLFRKNREKRELMVGVAFGSIPAAHIHVVPVVRGLFLPKVCTLPGLLFVMNLGRPLLLGC